MGEPLISVIVPVYKVEKYLKDCVDSIRTQTYQNLEIILVDDGSPDTCPTMCDEFAEQDSRIVVIHKKNGGLSDARNAGLDIAKGDYIGFVDSDDYIAPEMYEVLLRRLTSDEADAAVCNYLYVSENHEKISALNQDMPVHDECLRRTDVFHKMTARHGVSYIVAWNKLYKQQIFDSLRFPVGKQHEDEFLIHHIVQRCKKVSCIEQPLYFYVQRKGSIIGRAFNVKNMDYGDALIDRYHFAKKNGYQELREACAVRLSSEMEKWKRFVEEDELCQTKYEELRKKARFLIFEKSAWEGYNVHGKIYMRVELLAPKVAEFLLKNRGRK